MAKKNKMPQSPGTVLNLFMRGFDLNPTRLAREIKMSQAAVRLLALDKAKISVSAALRLGKIFKINPGYWLDLQNKYDLSIAEKDAKLMKTLQSILPVKKPSAKAGGARKAAADKKPAAGRGRKAKTAAHGAVKRGPKKAAGRASAQAASPKTPGRRGRKPAARKA